MPRLTRIITRTGDDGSTGLAFGDRVSKASLRIQAMGSVDELNSFIGLLLVESLPESIRALLLTIQHDLFDIGGELAMPEHSIVTEEALLYLEEQATLLNRELPALKEFILPGGSPQSAWTHIARATARRAERDLVALAESGEVVTENSRRYLNRLSDLLFILARELNRVAGQTDVFWRKENLPKKTSEETA